MEYSEALALVTEVFKNTHQRSLNNSEELVFWGIWEGKTYEQIANETKYTAGTISKDIAHKFWKLLSEALGEKVRKNNFKVELERYKDRKKNPIQGDKIIDNKDFEAFKIIIDIIKKQRNKETDVITISANNYDEFIQIDKICPEHECVIEEDQRIFCAGGSGANTICGLAKLGKKTAIVGCVKDDSKGHRIRESFKDFSVDSELLIINNELDFKTGSTQVLVEKSSGRRQILVTPGINSCLSEILQENNEQKLEDVLKKVKTSKIIHLTSFASKAEMELQSTILNLIRNENIIVSLTPGAIYVAEGLDGLNKILACTNIMFVYAQQLDLLLERSPDEIYESIKQISLEDKINLFFAWRIKKQMLHPMILVIKDSLKYKSNNMYKNYISVATNFENKVSFFEHQSIKFNKQGRTFIPEDTTGTGDALVAGFLYGILEGKSIETCTDFGFIMSKEVSHKLGARTNLPDKDLLISIANGTRTC